MPLKKSHFFELILIINSVYENYHNCVVMAYFSTYLNFRAKNGKNTHVYSDVDFWRENSKWQRFMELASLALLLY